MRSSTVIAAGQIAVMVVGFALGVVVTLIVVIDQWGTPAPPSQTAAPAAVHLRRPPPPAIALPAAPPVSGEPVLPARAVPPPKPAPAAAEPPGGRYAVQAGAFLSEAAANAMARRLDAAGHPTVVQVQTGSGGRALNVVRLTETFETRALAQAAARALGNAEGVSTLVARLPATPSAANPPARP